MAAFSGLGAAAFAAFTYGAFSFFSDLADPRARAPRPAPMASAWPDLKDGVPALARPVETKPPALVTAAAETPSPVESFPPAPPPAAPAPAAAPNIAASLEPAPAMAPELKPAVEPAPVAPAQAESSPAPVAPAQAESSPAPTPPLRGNRPDLPIVTVATVGAARILTPIEPPRPIAAILPAKAETVRAKPVPTTFVSLPSDAEATPAPQTVAAAAEPAPAPMASGESKPAASPAAKPRKPALSRAAAKPTRTAAREAEPQAAEAAAAPAPAPKAESDDSGAFDAIPGGREIRHGVKAIGDLFTGKQEGE